MHVHAIRLSDDHRITHHGSSALNGLKRSARATTDSNTEQEKYNEINKILHTSKSFEYPYTHPWR